MELSEEVSDCAGCPSRFGRGSAGRRQRRFHTTAGGGGAGGAVDHQFTVLMTSCLALDFVTARKDSNENIGKEPSTRSMK